MPTATAAGAKKPAAAKKPAQDKPLASSLTDAIEKNIIDKQKLAIEQQKAAAAEAAKAAKTKPTPCQMDPAFK